MSGELDNGASGGIVLDDDTLLVLRDKNLLIEREWLTLGEIIGKGKQKTIINHICILQQKNDKLIYFFLNSKWFYVVTSWLLLYLY